MTPTAAFPSSDISGGSGDGVAVTFNFSTIINSSSDPDDAWIVIEFKALVDNVVNNFVNGTELDNTFTVTTTTPACSVTSAKAPVFVEDPKLAIYKGTVATNDPSYRDGLAADHVHPARVCQARMVAQRLHHHLRRRCRNQCDQRAGWRPGHLRHCLGKRRDGPNGAFDVEFTDTMPAGFSIPTTGAGLNLEVTDRTGPFLVTGNTTWSSDPFVKGLSGSNSGFGTPADLFGPALGLLIQAPPPPRPVVWTPVKERSDYVAGRNIAIITFDLQVTSCVYSEDFDSTLDADGHVLFNGSSVYTVPIGSSTGGNDAGNAHLNALIVKNSGTGITHNQSGSGYFLYDGTYNDGTTNYAATVWETPNAVPVTPDTNYCFSFYLTNADTINSVARIEPLINGVDIAGWRAYRRCPPTALLGMGDPRTNGNCLLSPGTREQPPPRT